MFKVGDIVEITSESSATGMLDFVDGKGYAVWGVGLKFNPVDVGLIHIKLVDESGRMDWYTASHFKLKKEDGVKFKIGDTLVCTETDPIELSATSITAGEEYVVTRLWEYGVRIVNDDGEEVGVCDHRFKLKEDTVVEKKECMFKVGQVVWDLRNGRGVVQKIVDDGRYPVVVKFDLKDTEGYEVTNYYTADGRFAITQNIRSLYFSEPKIEAATEPVFEAVLKKGDWVVLSDNAAQAIVKVVNETDFELFYEGDGAVSGVFKSTVDVYRLGEKIEFN